MLALWILVSFSMPFTDCREQRCTLREKERPLCWLVCVCCSPTQPRSLQVSQLFSVLLCALRGMTPEACNPWMALSSGFPWGLVGDQGEEGERLGYLSDPAPFLIQHQILAVLTTQPLANRPSCHCSSSHQALEIRSLPFGFFLPGGGNSFLRAMQLVAR